MSSVPADVAPLNRDQTGALQNIAAGLTSDQLQWASGYLAGLAAAGGAANLEPIALPAAPQAIATASNRLTILYGSQTGNGEALAASLANNAAASGTAHRLVSLADYKPAELKRETHVVLVVSTHGEGDPPDDAELFHEYLLSDRAPKLPALTFAVLALGDSSYVNFCQTGRDIDTRLAELGASRVAPLEECDLDFEGPAADWSARVLEQFADDLRQTGTTAVTQLHPVAAAPQKSSYDKNNPFPAELLVNQRITGAGSGKDVRHIELSTAESGLHYAPGDALAVVVENPPQLVEQLIEATGLSDGDSVAIGEQTMSLGDALLREREITALNARFLRDWAAIGQASELAELLQPDAKPALSSFLGNNQIVDVVRRHPAAVDAQTFADTLRGLAPRSYSIASSPLANPDEVHLTVAPVRYRADGFDHWGAASTHLADRISTGDTVPVFVEQNKRFRLPADDVPIVMIGPGTGVAPFRAFVEERAERGASGDSWLFFGERSFRNDFLYQIEWQRHLKRGTLARLDVAFSRDQRRKIYVQDRIRERATELYAWIQRGAVIYVCGDAEHMAGDVNDALIDVLAGNGNIERAAAEQQLAELRRSGRYLRDVY